MSENENMKKVEIQPKQIELPKIDTTDATTLVDNNTGLSVPSTQTYIANISTDNETYYWKSCVNNTNNPTLVCSDVRTITTSLNLPKVACFGNSITRALTSPLVLADSYCYKLNQTADYETFKWGVSAEQSSDLLARMTDVIGKGYSYTVLLIGTNDMSSALGFINTSNYYNNLLNITQQIKDDGQQVLISTLPPCNDSGDRGCSGSNQTVVEERNDIIRRVSFDKNICYADIFADVFNSTYTAGEFIDNLHPDADSHSLMNSTYYDSLQSCTSFDCNANPDDCYNYTVSVNYTSIKHIDIEVPDVLINSETPILISNSTIENIVINQTILFKSAINLIGTNPVLGGTAYVRYDLNGVTVYNESIRTVDDDSTWGVANYFFSHNATTGNLTIEVYAYNTGKAIEYSNFETHIFGTTSEHNNNLSFTDVSGTDTAVLNSSFVKVFNLTSLNTFNDSNLFIDLHIKMNASDESLPLCELRTPENIGIGRFGVYLSDSTSIRSSGIGVIDSVSSRSGNVTYSIWCLDTFNETVTGIVEGYILGLKDSAGRVINYNQTVLQNANLTSANSTILEVLNYAPSSGTGVEAFTTAVFSSLSGLQTVGLQIFFDGTMTDLFWRTLEAIGQGTVRFDGHYQNTSQTNFSLDVTISAGESIVMGANLFVLDVTDFNETVTEIDFNDISNAEISSGACVVNTATSLIGSVTCNISSLTNCQGNYTFGIPATCNFISGETGTYNLSINETGSFTSSYSCAIASDYEFNINFTASDNQLLNASVNSTCGAFGGGAGLSDEQSTWLEGIYDEVKGMGLILVVLVLLGLGLAFRNGLIVTISGIGIITVGNQLLSSQNWLFSAFLFMLGLFLFAYGFWLPRDK